MDERATGVARLPLEPADVPAPSTELRSSERAQGGDEAAGGRRTRREAAIVREGSQSRTRLPRPSGRSWRHLPVAPSVGVRPFPHRGAAPRVNSAVVPAPSTPSPLLLATPQFPRNLQSCITLVSHRNSTLMSVAPLLLMFLAPLAAGILLGFIQLAFYRILRRSEDSIPPFLILFARGLVFFFVIAATFALVLRISP